MLPAVPQDFAAFFFIPEIVGGNFLHKGSFGFPCLKRRLKIHCAG
jgi:hypothetical protein